MTLHEYRKARGLSRAKAAEQIGCDAISIYRWETGRSGMMQATMQRIIRWSRGQITADGLLRPTMPKRGRK